MFKKFFLPAVALLAITSCSSDEVVDANSNAEGKPFVTFNPIVGNNSRGTEATSETLKTTGFMVKAEGNGADFIPAQAATFSSNGFYLASNYYWPGYQLNFTAWAPTTLDLTKDITVGTTTTYGADADILVAYKEENRTSASTAAVNLNFNHALSQFVVKAQIKDADAAKNIKVTVKSVKLMSVKNTGKLALPTVENGKGTWTLGDAKAEYSYELASALELSEESKALTPAAGSFLMIPQAFSADAWKDGEAYLVLDVKIELLKDGEFYTHYEGLAAVDAFKGLTLAAGQRYIVNLIFDKDAAGNKNEPGGDPVIGKPIWFTVSVAGWEDLDPAKDVNMANE